MKTHKKPNDEDAYEEESTDKSIISDEMELSGDAIAQQKRIDDALPHIPSLVKTDITLDTIYSDLQNTELQLKLQQHWNKVNSPMRRVGNYLETNHHKFKGKEILYLSLAKILHLTEQQVYDAVKDLNVFENYSFKFHPTRNPHISISNFGSFEYSIDNFTRWAKENDIREKTINRKITVVQQSHEHMYPAYKERIKKNKIQRVKNMKKKIVDMQTVSVPVQTAEDEEE